MKTAPYFELLLSCVGRWTQKRENKDGFAPLIKGNSYSLWLFLFCLQRQALSFSPSLLQPNFQKAAIKLIMCHGHPRDHPCSHTSMIWYYCPSANINLTTGYETPCSNVTLAPAQSSKAECPIKRCAFSNKGRRWRCCRCGSGPNQQAWCAMRTGRMGEAGRMTCDHGCCDNCTEFGKSLMK